LILPSYARQRTERQDNSTYNNASSAFAHLINRLLEKTLKTNLKQLLMILGGTSVMLLVACSSMKTPATADVAVTKAAVDNASTAGGTEYAPAEMQSAREKLALANQAMKDRRYKDAGDLAAQAQADAKLAQSKANTAKAQANADALQSDIRAMREELDRANK
jgi:hypothetical protein